MSISATGSRARARWTTSAAFCPRNGSGRAAGRAWTAIPEASPGRFAAPPRKTRVSTNPFRVLPSGYSHETRFGVTQGQYGPVVGALFGDGGQIDAQIASGDGGERHAPGGRGRSGERGGLEGGAGAGAGLCRAGRPGRGVHLV